MIAGAAGTAVTNNRRCTLPKHRQECLCHIDLFRYRHLRKYLAAGVAQTLLSVLVRLGRTEKSTCGFLLR